MFNQFKEKMTIAKDDRNDVVKDTNAYINEVEEFAVKIDLNFEYLNLMINGDFDDLILILQNRHKKINDLIERGKSLLPTNDNSDNDIIEKIEALEEFQDNNQKIIDVVEETKNINKAKMK